MWCMCGGGVACVYVCAGVVCGGYSVYECGGGDVCVGEG